jgi:ATP-binding cassette subfamily B multidrug efflux pump
MNTLIKNTIKRCDENLHVEIDTMPPEGLDKLPTTLWPFIWFFAKQVKIPLIGIAITEGIFAALISVMFWYVGALVEQAEYGIAMMWLGIALLTIRFVCGTLCEIFYHLIYIPYVGNLIRRQLYWYTARQSLSFFQNDFAGRIANKLLQSAPALRDAVKSTIGAVWFAAVFTLSNLWFLTQVNVLLALPLSIWLCCYILVLWKFVPKVQKRSALHAEDMSTLTGQVVDSFTNFLPIKYFARTEHEDDRVLGLLRNHSRSLRHLTGTIWQMSLVIDVLNTALLVSTGFIGYWLVTTQGQIGIAATAMALPMVLQATFQSGWIMYEVSGIFENLGAVQEGIDILTKPHGIVDGKDAPLLIARDRAASVEYRHVYFNYDRDEEEGEDPILKDFNLSIPAGQKVGLVGRSGAGKSTLTSLIVRAYDVQSGEIFINDQDIATVTQNSLRENITVVTQESYLFHRSIIDNIRYGKPDATIEEVIAVAKRANAHEFILGLEDNAGRKGYDAHVGERGVKLSGGQKQRVGIARAILKDAPILILDEATSALDSESEHAIQSALESIMIDKTVIAVAHRLSTLRQMDRILVLDAGKIVEDGTHDELAAKSNGHYAMLWQMQSGGFLKED